MARSLGTRWPSGNPLGRKAVPAPIRGGADELTKGEMNGSQDEPPHELEDQFILRLPVEHASTVRKMMHSGSSSMKNKLKIDLLSDTRHAIVEVDKVSLAAKLVDLPCVIGSLKSLDRKTFYKTADVSQMLVCTADADVHYSKEPVTSTDLQAIVKTAKGRRKKYAWKHGITPPLKNVRKKRFRKTIKKPADSKQMEELDLLEYIESPEVEKEVKRLLCSDAEAVSARWEVIDEDETKEKESQESTSGYSIASGMSDCMQGHTLPDYMLQEMCNNCSNSTEEDDKEEEEEEEEDYDDEEEEEDYYDEDIERWLQARFIENGQYEAKEGTILMVMEIQKHTQYIKEKLHEIQHKAQRQKELIRKVENLILKTHLQSVLEELNFQEKERTKKLIYLQEKLNYFLKK